MTTFMRQVAVSAWLCGLMFLSLSCSDDNGSSPSDTLQMARQAEQKFLRAVSVESGAVVSFVGPVSPGTRLTTMSYATQYVSIAAPANGGIYYLFFINDHPDTRYAHSVRYAWLNLTNGHAETVAAEWWPYLDATPADNTEFQLIEADTLSGVIFYYGSGGGLGFPPAYLPAEQP